MDLKIGDQVWIFDGNMRKYKDDEGNETTGTWYRGHFCKRCIIGETKQSWIIGYEGNKPDNRDIKVNKKTLRYPRQIALDGRLYVSEEEINQECWMKDNTLRISEKIRQCKDYHLLRQIELLLSKE